MSEFNIGTEYAKLNGYTIYQFQNKNAYNYFLSIPDQYANHYQMFIGFPKKDLKNSSKKDIINEIDDIKKMITSLNKDGIYLLPDIPISELEQAALENDGKKYNKLLTEIINPMIFETYQTLSSYNTAERTINQVIILVKQTESDRKFIDWFEINMPNFIHGITYEEIKKYYYEQLSRDINARDEKKDKIFVNPNKYDEQNFYNINQGFTIQQNFEEHQLQNQTKTAVKRRVLTKPNNQGFSNIFKMLLLLSIILGASAIIGKFILK